MLDHNLSIEFNENTQNDVNHSNQTFDLFSRMSTRKSLDAQHQGFFMRISKIRYQVGIATLCPTSGTKNLFQ